MPESPPAAIMTAILSHSHAGLPAAPVCPAYSRLRDRLQALDLELMREANHLHQVARQKADEARHVCDWRRHELLKDAEEAEARAEAAEHYWGKIHSILSD